MENIATRAPWLSSLSLIAAKIRPIWISPAVKLHLENWGKDHDEKSRTSGISPDQSAWQTWPAPDTGRSLGFPAHWAALLQHEDWLLSKIMFHLQGCLRQLRVWFPYFKELLPKCSHDIITRLLLMYNVRSNHCTVVQDACEQPRLLVDPLGNHGGWRMAAAFPQVFQTCPPKITVLQPTLRVSFMFFRVFRYPISRRSSGVCTYLSKATPCLHCRGQN